MHFVLLYILTVFHSLFTVDEDMSHIETCIKNVVAFIKVATYIYFLLSRSFEYKESNLKVKFRGVFDGL